jgi:predicted HAD superfamily phosphohydrolase YqeG
MMNERLYVFSDDDLALHTPISSPADNNRAGFTWEKASHFLSLPFKPQNTHTFRKYGHVGEMNVEELRHHIEAVAFDIDGVLTPHEGTEIEPEILAVLEEMRARMKAVCFYSNSRKHRDFFGKVPIQIARHVPAKPDPAGFEVVRKLYLNNTPAHFCAMVGDNYAVDGGCRAAGWKYIHVDPLPGDENPIHKLARSCAAFIAKFHDRLFQRYNFW